MKAKNVGEKGKKHTFRKVGIFLAAFAGCVLLCGGVLESNYEKEPETVVAYLDGLPLTYGEYRLLVPRYRALVLSQVNREYGLSEEEGFWERKLPDGSTPGERLNEQVLAQWKEIKKEQKCFIDAGVMEPFDYAEFQDAWEKENERRRQKLEAGEVIYGPVQYEEEAYYFYLQDRYRNEAERKSGQIN